MARASLRGLFLLIGILAGEVSAQRVLLDDGGAGNARFGMRLPMPRHADPESPVDIGGLDDHPGPRIWRPRTTLPPSVTERPAPRPQRRLFGGADPTQFQTVNEGVVNVKLKDLNIPIPTALPSRTFTVSHDAAECTAAERHLRTAMASAQGKAYLDEWASQLRTQSQFMRTFMGAVLDDDDKPLADAVAAYDAACVAPASAFVPGAALARHLAQAAGVLLSKEQDNWGIFCSGTRISADLVLTARHCFDDPEAGLSLADSLERAAAHDYEFMLPGTSTRAKVTELLCYSAATFDSLCRKFLPADGEEKKLSGDMILVRAAFQGGPTDFPEVSATAP